MGTTKQSDAEGFYFLFDTETGGIEKEMSLLTLHGLLLDKNLNVYDRIDLKIKPDDGKYKVNASAMRVNKIDLLEHDQVAIVESSAGLLFRNFVFKHSNTGKLVPVGQNVRFDVKFARQHLLHNWDLYFSRRHLDTAAVALFLRQAGKLPANLDCSLGALIKFFEIRVDPTTLHDARVDAEATLEVLRNLLKLVNSPPPLTE